jgi:hypothetical protein
MGWRTDDAYERAREEARKRLPLSRRYAWRQIFALALLLVLFISLMTARLIFWPL